MTLKATFPVRYAEPLTILFGLLARHPHATASELVGMFAANTQQLKDSTAPAAKLGEAAE